MKKAKSKPAKKSKAATPLDAVPDRKIVQVAPVGVGSPSVFVLCDDGTVWVGLENWLQVKVDQIIFNTPPAATLALEAAHRRIDTLSGELADAKAKKE